MVKPVVRRQAAGHLRGHYKISERRASRVLRIERSTLRYQPRPDRNEALRQRLLELSAENPRYGYQMLTDRLRLEGELVNHKRVYRLYREEGLQLPKRRRKRIRSVARAPIVEPASRNERWAMDFLHDMLADGRKIRVFALIDEFTRECLVLDVAPSIPGDRVARVLSRVIEERGAPEVIVSDNGPEFTGRALDRWASAHRVRLHFIQPGKPTQNAFIESFNSTIRRECLNAHWFGDLGAARQSIETWRQEYNEQRPHKKIGRIPPAAFAAKVEKARLKELESVQQQVVGKKG